MGNKLQDARDFAVDIMEALIAESETDLAETKRINFCQVILGGSSWGGGPAGTIAVINNDGNETCTGASDGTGLFHAIDFAADDLKQRSASNLRLLVVISDGVDSTDEDESVAVNALSGGSIVTRLVYIGTGTSPFTSIVNSVSGSNIDDFSITSDNLDDLVDDIVDAARCVNTAPTPKINLDTEFRLGVEGFRNDFQNNSTDIDDGPGTVKVKRWELFKPDGTLFNETTSLANSWSPLLTDDELPEENWRVKLTVEDSDGLTNSVSEIFRVIGSPPNVSINSGPVTAGDPIELSVSPTSDVDGGDFVSTIWDVLQSPVDAQFAPQSGIGTGLVLDPIDTTDQDIGTWEFKVTVTDDEETSGFAEVIVDVVNAPPEIELDWPEEVDVGQPITAMTTVIDDVDGGVLTFDWGIIQAPQSAPLTEQPQEGFSGGSAGAGSALASIDTVEAHAGTWIFRLTATDDDQAQNSVVEEEFEVLVDGLPEATIKCLSCRDPDAVSHGDIGSASFPLVLDSGESFDPDSPPPPPCPVGGLDKCHNTLDGRQVFLSEGLTRVWSLIDFPGDLLQPIQPGRVDDNEVFGVTATGSKLTLDITDLEAGDWTFEVEVEDGEDNEEFSTFDVRVVEENGPPKVNLSAPARYTTDLSSILEEDIVLSGFLSLDPDNILEILDGTDLEPGSGITDYLWEILEMPSGCSQLPTLPSGPNEDTVNLYTADTVIDSACQGNWRIKLTVTDDDLLPRTASAETIVIIGNCAQPLCVDLPTNANPLFVEFSEGTDIFIYYHLDSALYDDPSFDFGMVSVVEIYHESDLSTPVYTAPPDYNVQGSGKGSSLVFHWNGYGNSPTGLTSIDSPQSGLYTVNVTLYRYEEEATLGFVLVPTAFTATELSAIWMVVTRPELLSTSDRYVNFDELNIGVAQINLDYSFTGFGSSDDLCWNVFNEVGANLVTECIPTPATAGTINWSGQVGGTTLQAGEYTVELEAFSGGSSLGKSPRHAFTVIRVDLDVDTDRDGSVIDVADDPDEDDWTKSRGAIFVTNHDRDGARVISGDPAPDALTFNDLGHPVGEEMTIETTGNDVDDIAPLVVRNPGVALPPGVTYILKVAELQDIESVHVFKKIMPGQTAIWGGLGTRTGGAAQALEFDITSLINPDPSNSNFAGPAPDQPITLGIEGLLHRYTVSSNELEFNGEVDFTLEVRDGGSAIFSDTVRLKIAPWIMLPHTQLSQQVWAEDAGAGNDEFRLNAIADPGYFGLDASGQLNTAALSEAATQWFQDHVEVGYVQRPGAAARHSTFRLPYFWRAGSSQPPWSINRLLDSAHGAFQIGLDFGRWSGDYGGNLEVMPPEPAFPLGRIVHGNTMSMELVKFLTDQEVQPPASIPTSWLTVGHVDEAVAFTPVPGEAIIAHPARAWALMNAVPAAERGARVFFATGGTTEVHTASGATSDRINVTGVDFTGTTWEYLRIFSDVGSGAAGQVAHISGRGMGFLEVDEIWDTPTKLVPPPPPVVFAGDTVLDHLDGAVGGAPSGPPWLTTPATGDRFVLVENSRKWITGLPSIITVEEVLADADLEVLNTVTIAAELATIRANLNAARGAPFTYREVPAVYLGRGGTTFSFARTAGALVPGASNVQFVGGVPYFPRQFSFLGAGGNDAFEAEVRSLFPTARFVDDWDFYHRLLGEVHCGTTVVRTIYALDWWEHQP